MQRWTTSRLIPLASSEAQHINKSCFVCQQKTETADGFVADSLGKVPRETDAGSHEGYKWVLTGIDTKCDPGFAYLMIDANAQRVIEILEQEIVHHFGWLTIISSDMGLYQPRMPNNQHRIILLTILV